MKITIIQTGGTIDKDYPKTDAYAFEIREPAVKRILERVNPNFEYDIISILKKDSTDINEEDRDKIYHICKDTLNDKILITHGTDTMTETAMRLSSIKDKVIVLTGSMMPEMFKESDADFNIGVAIGALNIYSEGIYIAMNGQVHPYDKVTKDQETGFFTKIL